MGSSIELKSSEFQDRCNLKVASFQAKIDENFVNLYFLKGKANNICSIVLKCTCKGLQKSLIELER